MTWTFVLQLGLLAVIAALLAAFLVETFRKPGKAMPGPTGAPGTTGPQGPMGARGLKGDPGPPCQGLCCMPTTTNNNVYPLKDTQ